MEGDKTVAQRPLLHRFLQDHLLREDHHLDVVEAAQALQDLGHRLGLGLLGHGADPHHDLSLGGLGEEQEVQEEEEEDKGEVVEKEDENETKGEVEKKRRSVGRWEKRKRRRGGGRGGRWPW